MHSVKISTFTVSIYDTPETVQGYTCQHYYWLEMIPYPTNFLNSETCQMTCFYTFILTLSISDKDLLIQYRDIIDCLDVLKNIFDNQLMFLGQLSSSSWKSRGLKVLLMPVVLCLILPRVECRTLSRFC